jgi:hypothetical protein
VLKSFSHFPRIPKIGLMECSQMNLKGVEVCPVSINEVDMPYPELEAYDDESF